MNIQGPPLLRHLIFSSLVLLLLTARSLAQTTAPSAPAPPAIEGAYEHDSLRHSGEPSTAISSKTAPAASSPYSSPLDIRRVALALGIVLGLVFICRWAARWMFPSVGAGRSSQVMKVLSRSVIAPKQQLLLIQVGRRLVVVGDSGQQMTALTEINDPDEVASLLGQLRADSVMSESSKPFDPLLGRAQRQFEEAAMPTAGDPEELEDELVSAGVDETRGELSGLTEKIRSLSRELGKM